MGFQAMGPGAGQVVALQQVALASMAIAMLHNKIKARISFKVDQISGIIVE